MRAVSSRLLVVCGVVVCLQLVMVLSPGEAAARTPAAHVGQSMAPFADDLVLLQGPGVAWCDDVVVHDDQDALFEGGCGAGEIRPGARGNGCTLDFVVTDGDDHYIGTAGHCGGVGATFGVPGVGPIGKVVFRELDGSLLGFKDWAFIKVDEDKEPFVSGRMYRFGGPFAAHPDLLTRPPVVGDVVFQYGHGAGWGQDDATRGRVGQVAVLFGTTAFGYLGTVGGGDSGSPVRFATGEAAGIAVAVAGGSIGDYRDAVTRRCDTLDEHDAIDDSCFAYDATCAELDGACVGPFRPGALYGLVIVTRFDAAKAAFDAWLGRETMVVPGALPGIGLAP